MNKLVITLLIIIPILIGCTNNSSYSVSANLSDNKSDSASLYIYEPSYKLLRKIEQVPIYSDKKIKFSGEIQGSRIAFIKLNKDTVPYYFVLDSIPLSLVLGSNRLTVKEGSHANYSYAGICSRIKDIKVARIKAIKEYNVALKDTLLTKEKEVVTLSQIKEYENAIQKLILDNIQSDTPESYLIWRRYGNMLPRNLVPDKYKKSDYL